MSWLKRWKKRRGGERLPLPKTMNQQEAKQLLESIGYECTAGGKHLKMEKPGIPRPIMLSQHRGEQYGKALTQSILKEAGLLGRGGK